MVFSNLDVSTILYNRGWSYPNPASFAQILLLNLSFPEWYWLKWHLPLHRSSCWSCMGGWQIKVRNQAGFRKIQWKRERFSAKLSSSAQSCSGCMSVCSNPTESQVGWGVSITQSSSAAEVHYFHLVSSQYSPNCLPPMEPAPLRPSKQSAPQNESQLHTVPTASISWPSV